MKSEWLVGSEPESSDDDADAEGDCVADRSGALLRGVGPLRGARAEVDVAVALAGRGSSEGAVPATLTWDDSGQDRTRLALAASPTGRRRSESAWDQLPEAIMARSLAGLGPQDQANFRQVCWQWKRVQGENMVRRHRVPPLLFDSLKPSHEKPMRHNSPPGVWLVLLTVPLIRPAWVPLRPQKVLQPRRFDAAAISALFPMLLSLDLSRCDMECRTPDALASLTLLTNLKVTRPPTAGATA